MQRARRAAADRRPRRAGPTIRDRDGAADWNRTSDPVLTKDVLYRLSYGSARGTGAACRRRSHAISGWPSQAAGVTGVAAPDERDEPEAAPGEAQRSPPSPAAERAERLARALRQNLRRRKEQARARRAAEPEDSPPAPPDRPSGRG
jgi:hypothetical protein